MTVFRLNPSQYEKWVYQNCGDVADFIEGTLLDSVLIDCKRGRAAIFETALNEWSSAYIVYFAPYKDPDALENVNSMWDTFAGCELFETA